MRVICAIILITRRCVDMPHINAKPQMLLKWGQIRCQMFQAHILIAMIYARWALHITAIRGRLQRTPNTGVMQKLCKLMITHRTHNGMIKNLCARPVKITDHAVPRVAHDGKDEIILHCRCIHNPINIPQGAVFPHAPRWRRVRPANRLRRCLALGVSPMMISSALARASSASVMDVPPVFGA